MAFPLRLLLVAAATGWIFAFLLFSQVARPRLNDAKADAEETEKEPHSSARQLPGIAVRPPPPGWLPPQDPMDYEKPRVFFDIEIDGKPAGRIVFELFTKQAPRAAENFRALCTGEKGRVPKLPGREGAGLPLHYKGARFYRVIDKFIDQTGIPTESIYGGQFADDPAALKLKHDRKGLLSAANMGPDTTTTHFSILMAPAPHLNGHYPIFGQVVSGAEVTDRINSLARPSGSGTEEPLLPVVVADCGQLV